MPVITVSVLVVLVLALVLVLVLAVVVVMIYSSLLRNHYCALSTIGVSRRDKLIWAIIWPLALLNS